MTRLGYQIRLSALSGIQSTVQVLFVTVALLPIRLIFNRLFFRSAASDWKVSFLVGGSIATLSYIAVFVSTFVDLRRETGRTQKLRQTFPASAFMTGLYGGLVVFAAVMVVGTRQEGDPVWVQLTPFTFVLIALIGWPRTIRCDATGIWQRTRFGQKMRIPYDEVLSVAYEEGSTFVTGKQATIEHTLYHAGGERFQRTLEKRSGKLVDYPER